MKLSMIQWLWMMAVVVFFATVMLDLANVMNVPPIYWLLASTSLMVIGWWVGPSMQELKKAQRRMPR